jgi:proteasome lid subunit RPN8/RPN11
MHRTLFHGTVIRNEPAYRPRPIAMADYHKFSNGGYDALVAVSVLEAIADKTRQAAPNEMIGYLVGRPFRDAKGSYAIVAEAIFAESARCGLTTAETTLHDERELLATLLADYPLAERLGWFHSHPFFMPAYSPTDLENQRFWSESYQLGLLACLDRAGNVSIFAFRGPESEALHPPYMMPSTSHSNRIPEFRPVMRETQDRETTPKAAEPMKQTTDRRASLALLTLAVGVVWPIIYLLGVWTIVQAMREGRDSATRPAAVAKDGAGSPDESSPDISVEVLRPTPSALPTPARPVGPLSQEEAGHR